MQAGKLDRTVSLELLSEEVGPSGAVARTWTPFATVRAQVTQQELEDAQAAPDAPARARLKVLIRWRPDLHPSHRLTYQGRAYNIVDLREIGRRRALELEAVAE
jgi:SPP1 family predicted phage head-tail adaptor